MTVGLSKSNDLGFFLGTDDCDERATVEAEEIRVLANELFGEATTRWETTACDSVPGVSIAGGAAPGFEFADAQALLSDAGCSRLRSYPAGLTCFMGSPENETAVDVIRRMPDGEAIDLISLSRNF